MYENKGTGKMPLVLPQNPEAKVQASNIELQLLAPES
jgi:hypothetical protein